MKSKIIKIPALGRYAITKDAVQGTGQLVAGQYFQTNLKAEVFRNGKPVKAKEVMPFWNRFWNRIDGNKSLIDLGSGLVTNIGAQALGNEAVTLASPSGSRINLLFLASWHATGTGVTAAASTDFKIQTISTNGGQTPVQGAPTISTSLTGAVPKIQTQATISYTGSEAVTEWGLFTSNTLNSTTGSPFTAATATTWTDTGSAQTASSSTVQGLQQTIVIPGTTAVYGLNQSNTTHIGTLCNNGTTGWFNQSNGAAGSTPGNTETFTIRPIMWDHKVFSAINVNSGDSIQFTYTLQINSGG